MCYKRVSKADQERSRSLDDLRTLLVPCAIVGEPRVAQLAACGVEPALSRRPGAKIGLVIVRLNFFNIDRGKAAHMQMLRMKF